MPIRIDKNHCSKLSTASSGPIFLHVSCRRFLFGIAMRTCQGDRNWRVSSELHEGRALLARYWSDLSDDLECLCR